MHVVQRKHLCTVSSNSKVSEIISSLLEMTKGSRTSDCMNIIIIRLQRVNPLGDEEFGITT